MKFLSGKDLLALRQRKIIEVEVPELGGGLRLQEFSQGSAERLVALNKRKEAGESVDRDIVIFLLTVVAVNENSKPLMTPTEADSMVEGLPLEKMKALTSAILDHFTELLPKVDDSGNS